MKSVLSTEASSKVGIVYGGQWESRYCLRRPVVKSVLSTEASSKVGIVHRGQ